MQRSEYFLQKALAEGTSEQDKGTERAVGLVFDEEARGISEYQPEENDRDVGLNSKPTSINE